MNFGKATEVDQSGRPVLIEAGFALIDLIGWILYAGLWLVFALLVLVAVLSSALWMKILFGLGATPFGVLILFLFWDDHIRYQRWYRKLFKATHLTPVDRMDDYSEG